MKKLLLLPVMLGVCAPVTFSQSPGRGFPKPPDPLETQTTQNAPPVPVRHIDLEQLQKEADDLARTADTIPSDMASVRKGMLPKDVINKLKQIEKLSKRLRNELNP